MKYFYLAHYDAEGNPLGKNYLNHKDPSTTINIVMKSAKGSKEEIEQLPDFSRWLNK